MKNNISFSNVKGDTLKLTQEFQTTFPILSKLLSKAMVVEFTINSNRLFRQWIWQQGNGTSCGWLCELERQVPQALNFIPEHIMLVKGIGGIVEYWGRGADTTFLYAKNFVFGLKDACNGLAGWDNDYTAQCQKSGMTPWDISQLLTFSLEANGDVVFYDKSNGKVFGLAHDLYSPSAVQAVENQPKMIYAFQGVVTFVDYVECLAEQWLEQVITH